MHPDKGCINNKGIPIRFYGQHTQDIIPDFESCPFEKTFMDSIPWSEFRR